MRLLSVLVVGGGPTGVEFCGELGDFIRSVRWVFFVWDLILGVGGMEACICCCHWRLSAFSVCVRAMLAGQAPSWAGL